MKHTIILFLLLSVKLSVLAQTDTTPHTLQVVGNSKIAVKPDLGILIISITNKDLNFSQAIVGLDDKTRDISKQIIEIGFKEDDIKTTDFQITENRIYVRQAYIDSGYLSRQNIKVEFKYQKETITKILNKFSTSRTDFALSFDFRLTDELKDKAQDELLKLAIKDAKGKAKVIAGSSGVKLGKIRSINYGTNYSGGMREVQETAAYKTMAAREGGGAIAGFTPNDLLFADNVLITWEIE